MTGVFDNFRAKNIVVASKIADKIIKIIIRILYAFLALSFFFFWVLPSVKLLILLISSSSFTVSSNPQKSLICLEVQIWGSTLSIKSWALFYILFQY